MKTEAKRYFKDLWQGDTDLQEDYTSYTEIPDFEEQIDIITAKYQEKMEELTAWETIIDQGCRITVVAFQPSASHPRPCHVRKRCQHPEMVWRGVGDKLCAI